MERLSEKLSRLDSYPFHMPGHKRNTEMLGGGLPYQIDITEITDFDNLHGADGVIKDIEDRLAEFYSAKRSFLLVNGSTCGIMAGITALCDFGDRIIVARNCHKSVYRAIELYNLKPCWIYPNKTSEASILGEVTASSVEATIERCPDARLAVIASPTYEGIISDTAAISEVCKRHNVRLFCDMAHGAHLPLFDGFESAYGADIAVTSLHKTLPCLTQVACLNIFSDGIDEKKIALSLGNFETSSPSYPLMASADRCMSILEKRGAQLAKSYHERIEKFYADVAGLRHLRILFKGDKNFDFSKLVISCAGCSITGVDLFALLRDRYMIECEMASLDYVIAMTSICDTQEGFDRLAAALNVIDGEAVGRKTCGESLPQVFSAVPDVRMTAYEARRKALEKLRLCEAVGRISGEYIWVYPPGIPIIAPGEVMTQEIVSKCRLYEASGITVHFEGEKGVIGVIGT